jgi:hypothetical protein
MTTPEITQIDAQIEEIAGDYKQLMSEEPPLDSFFVIEDLAIRVESDEFSEHIGVKVLESLNIDLGEVTI